MMVKVIYKNTQYFINKDAIKHIFVTRNGEQDFSIEIYHGSYIYWPNIDFATCSKIVKQLGINDIVKYNETSKEEV